MDAGEKTTGGVRWNISVFADAACQLKGDLRTLHAAQLR